MAVLALRAYTGLRRTSSPAPGISVEEWLLIEWPEDEVEPTNYWLSTLPEDISFHRLVDIAKLRWRIERDYQELKQEVGLGHYEGRGWRGFHHHATLCIAAYGFLISERETIPPKPCSIALFAAAALPKDYRPRGAAVAPERHISNSIATMRRQLAIALARTLSRCPCCCIPISQLRMGESKTASDVFRPRP